MPIHLTCHKCGAQLVAGDELAGGTGKCANCGAQCVVPAALPNSETIPTLAQWQPGTSSPRPPEFKHPANSAQHWPIKTELAVFACVAATVVVAVFYISSSILQPRANALPYQASFKTKEEWESDKLTADLEKQAEEQNARDKESAEFAKYVSEHPFVAPIPPSPPWRDKTNWSRLREGMSETEVISLLGQPSGRHTIQLSPVVSRTITLYYSFYSVEINDAKGVTSWSGPD